MSQARNFADLLASGTVLSDTKLPTITSDKLDDNAIHGNRNLIINGAMNVNQYGSSSTAAGRQTVDRFYNIMSTDATITQSKTAITSGSPYDEGFRNVYKHTVTTASTSPTSGHYLGIEYRFEAQDVSGSGWNYTSTSSSVTLSFWAKSSVAGTYTVSLRSPNSVHKDQSFEYTLTANTWKKVTHTFTGDSGITILNDNTIGLTLYIWIHLGADFTDSSHTYNTWVNYDGYSQANDYAQNWMQTASATFEVTGVQLEVGEATPFEHRSFPEELARCKRYYQKSFPYGTAPFNNAGQGASGTRWDERTAVWPPNSYGNSTYIGAWCHLSVPMRVAPTTTQYNCNTQGTSGSYLNDIQNGSLSTSYSITSTNHNTEKLHFYAGGIYSYGNALGVNWEADAEL